MKKNFTSQFFCAMLFISFSAQAQDNLFISELTDPADDYSGRFVELYNAGSELIDFGTSVFYLSRQSNGGTSWGDLQLAGTIAAGGTFVIGGSGFEALYGFAPDQVSGILIGNGDDCYALFAGGDHETGVLHDILGVIDVDGTGEPWEYEDSRALRLEDVLTPNISWTASEWEIASANLVDCDPGTHQGLQPGDTITPGSFSLALTTDTLTPGQSAEVAVLVGELGEADNIISYQFDIDFDAASLEFTGGTLAGTLAEGGTVVVNTGIAGRLSVGYMNASPLVGAGEILLLQFTALVPDTIDVLISNAFLNTRPVEDLTHGTIVIAETAPPTGVISFSESENRFADTLVITATFSEAMAESPPVRLSMSGALSLADEEMVRTSETVYTYLLPIPRVSGAVSIIFSSGTDLWGNAVIPEPTSGGAFTIIEFVPGDVNDDGVIQAYDAALALQYSVGIDPLPETDPMPWDAWRDSTANVDGSAGITANDAGMILQYSAGIITGFPSESTKKTAMAYVSAELVDDHIVFYSHGDLLGLNINTDNKKGILGIPEVLNEEYMWAVNMAGSAYRIGLCTAVSPSEGHAVIKIPVQKNGSVTFHLIENTEEREMTVNLSTDMHTFGLDQIKLYPNPVTDVLRISGIPAPLLARIYNIHGQLLRTTHLDYNRVDLEVSELYRGVYMITFELDKKTETRKFLKQ